MWLLDPEVIGLVEEWWKKEVVVGSECNALILSWKESNKKFSNGIKSHFKTTIREKENIEELHALNQEVTLHGRDQDHFKEKELLCKYEDLLSKEET